MDKLRSSVRPVLTYAFAFVILGLTTLLVWKFADASMARDFAVFTLWTGSAIIGIWTGSRLAKP